jgi:Spy/CpxP family protein refolding chaperone
VAAAASAVATVVVAAATATLAVLELNLPGGKRYHWHLPRMGTSLCPSSWLLL